MTFLLALLFLPVTTQAAPLSLSDAISEALQDSPRIQRSESEREQAHWKKIENTAGFLPSVSASGQRLLEKKYAFTDISFNGSPSSIPQIVPTTTISLLGQIPIFDGFANINRYRAASASEDAANQDLDWSRFQLEREVTLLYFKALGAKVLEQVAEQNIRTLNDHLKDSRLFRKAGVSTNYDVLRVEVQVSEANYELMNAKDNSAIAKNALGESLGKAAEDREISGTLPVLSPDLVKNLDYAVASERNDIRALENRSRSAELTSSAAAVHLVPRVSLFGQYQYYNNRNDEWRNGFRDAYQVGIQLNWNIFDGFASIARSKQSVEAFVQNEKNLAIAQLRSHQDLDLWKRKFLYFCSVYQSRLEDIQKTNENVRLAREGRKVGARTNTDLLDAETDLHRAQAGAVNAQLGAIEALLRLELAAGKTIHRFY
ncbi:MAG: TolC family protein [Bacteriovoracia bacterium]